MGSDKVFTIRPYKFNGQWVFDDAAVGLTREPFVGGADTILDVVTAHLPDADKGFLARFSARCWGAHQIELEWVREENGGNRYRWAGGTTPARLPDHVRQRACLMEGWLCPALFRYFAHAPCTLFVEVQPREPFQVIGYNVIRVDRDGDVVEYFRIESTDPMPGRFYADPRRAGTWDNVEGARKDADRLGLNDPIGVVPVYAEIESKP